MAGDWMEKSRLTRRMSWTADWRFPKIWNPVDRYLYEHGQEHSPVACVRDRRVGSGLQRKSEVECVIGSDCFDITGSWRDGVLIRFDNQVVAHASFALDRDSADALPPPPWDRHDVFHANGIVADDAGEFVMWLGTRSLFLPRFYAVDTKGGALFSARGNGRDLRLRYALTTSGSAWYLALACFVAVLLEREASEAS